MPPTGPCPGIAEIERLAGSDEVPAALAGHIAECPACRARIEAARDESSFLDRVRKLSGGGGDTPLVAGYRSLEVLASGAQGVVYRAVQESTSRAVAIKALASGRGATPRQRARAEREAEIAARLRHPNIVTVFESRTLADGRIAVVMEFVDGVPLDDWKPPGAHAGERLRAFLRAFVAVCNGIHHAHLNGVIHRDLKPDNILVAAEGRPVVLDFGIAKAGGLQTTLTGEFAGTPAYASPEQVSGHPDAVDALTDVYSLGVILYKCVCGAMPYEVNGSILEIARTITEEAPIAPRRRDPSLPPDLEAIVMRALRKEKPLRYQSAGALAHDVERFLAGDPVEARSGSGWYLLRKAIAMNRRRLLWATAGVVVLAGAGAAVAISLGRAADSARLAGLRQEQAHAENVRARAVTELLREALPNADPEKPELASIIGSGFGRLYFRLETGAFKDDPAVDQAVRRLWGEVYTGLGTGKAAGLVEYAEVSLRNGLVRLRLEHGARHPEIAATMHELAGVLLVRKRLPEASQVCRDALAMRQGLDGPTSLGVGESQALLARIFYALGQPDDAAAEAEAALGVFAAFPDRDVDLQIASMTALKARVGLDARSPGECEAMVRDALLRRLRRLPPEAPEVFASLADAADLAALAPDGAIAGMLATAWGCAPGELPVAIRADLPLLTTSDGGPYLTRTAGRTAALGKLLRFEEALLGPNDPALVRALTSQMRAAAGEGLLGVRSTAALRAADLLAARFGPYDMSVLICVEEAATVLAFDGECGRAVELSERACEIWDALPPSARDPLLSADTRRRLAWFLALSGRTSEAIGEYRRAMEQIEAAVGVQHRTYALAESGLAFCLSHTGDDDGADTASRHAMELADRLPTTPDDQMGHICFVRGHILRARGRHHEARATLEKAWDTYYHLVGPRFPWQALFIEDIAGACDSLGDAAAAAEWRARGAG